MNRIIRTEMSLFLRKNTGIFLISALAFMLSCVAVNITWTNFLSAREEQKSMEESYGDRSYYKIMLNGGEEELSNFFSGKNAAAIKKAFEQLKAEKLFDYSYTEENVIEFFNDDDPSYSADDFPSYPPECVSGYETGNPEVTDNYLCLKAFYADRLFFGQNHVKLREGEWFPEDSYSVDSLDNLELPVILGNAYQGIYQVGDTISNAHIATQKPITLKVCGFLEADSYFYDNNNEKTILNRYMIVPAMETSEAYDNSVDIENDTFFKQIYDSMKLMNARIICKKSDAGQTTKRVYEIFQDSQLYELRLTDETGSAEKSLEEARNLAVSCSAVSIFITGFGVAVFCIQMRYKLLQQRKKYSVFLLNGITRKQMFLITAADTICILAFSDLLYAVFWVWNDSRGYDGLELSGSVFLLLLPMEILIICLMGFLGVKGISGLDMSGILRENE